MNKNAPSIPRLTTTSHFLTALILAAIGAVILVPLSAQPRSHAAEPTTVRSEIAHSETDPAMTTIASSTTSTMTAPTVVPTPPAPSTPPATTPVTAPPPARIAVAAVPNGYGCDPAIAYLRVHAAPGFTFECPGWADGHQAMSCDNVPGVCPGTLIIAISTPCPAAYMNEASNSWVVLGESHAPLDPYGYCQ
jgi:hypothetical protein